MKRRAFITVWLLAAIVQGCGTDDDRRVVGYLESDRVEISAETSEPIVRIAVAEGQAAAKGELLLQQDAAKVEAQRAGAQAVLAQVRARLDELLRGPRAEQIAAARANVAGAAEELEYLRLEYERAKRVYEQRLTSRESLDRAKASLDVARARLEAEEARLQELLEGTTVEELRQAENAVSEVEARLQLLDVEAGRLSAFAPADGIVDSILFEPGERPLAGQPMIIFLTGEQPHALVYVPESIRVSVASGTPARVFVDGLAAPLAGRVRWVSSDAAFTPYFALTERDRGRLSFAAEIDLEGAGRRLPDGVPVEVEFQGEDRP
jgi:HlyD family secretion protein